MASLALRTRTVIRDLLLRIGPRPTAFAASIYLSLRYRQRCHVSMHEGLWVHQFAEGTMVQTMIGGRTVKGLDRETRRDVLYAYTPNPGDTILDVGAGVGEEMLTFSRLVGPTGRVVSIEAHPVAFACLSEAVNRNRLTNVTALHLAIADDEGVLQISDLGGAHLANTVVTGDRGISVPATTLDAVATGQGLKSVDFLKVNIEGAERLLIRGMSSIVDHIQNVSLSCHDFLAERTGDETFKTKDVVRQFLISSGFELSERVDPRPEIADTIYGRRSEVRPDADHSSAKTRSSSASRG